VLSLTHPLEGIPVFLEDLVKQSAAKKLPRNRAVFGQNIPPEHKYFKAGTLDGYCSQMIQWVSQYKFMR
jgi:hypothetical protein